jgi:hypothetical protein
LEVEKLPIFAVTMKHTPESCAMFNDSVRKKFKECVAKRAEVAKKHEIKVLSAYTSILEHLVFYVVEAPSQLAVENYFTDIGFAFWNNVEIRQTRPVEDVIKKVVKK